jgi:hypothetical protein
MLLTLLVFCLPALAHDISGKWNFAVETDAGGGSPKFEFKQEGEKLTGTYSGLFGEAKVVGTVKGDRVEFSFAFSAQGESGKAIYKGTIESATRMKGEVEFPGFVKGTWTGTKQ